MKVLKQSKNIIDSKSFNDLSDFLIEKNIRIYNDINEKSEQINLNLDEVKNLIESSILSLFGIIEARKITYLINKIQNNLFSIKYNQKNEKALLTSILLINNSEHNFRIKILNN